MQLYAVPRNVVAWCTRQRDKVTRPRDDGIAASCVQAHRVARQSVRTATSAAWVGVEQQCAATSSINVRSVS